jgi:chemotaxis protein MotB
MSKFKYVLIALLPAFAACSTIDSFFGYPAPDQETEQAPPPAAPEQPASSAMDKELYAQESPAVEPETIPVEPAPQAQEPAYEPPVKAAPKDQLWVIVSFRSGHIDIDKKTRKTLKDLAVKFQSQARAQSLDIRGYADAEPIGGYPGKKHKSAHNFSSQELLSAARAKAVAKVFIDAGIDASIVHSEGFGATNFIADNDTRAGRAKNRRVEIHLLTN